jgi:hypothetical protein
MAAPTYTERRRRERGEPDEPEKITVAQAIAVLTKAAGSPRAQSALKTLSMEMEGPERDRPMNTSDSPGMRVAREHAHPSTKKDSPESE